jgi:hypothetical protein
LVTLPQDSQKVISAQNRFRILNGFSILHENPSFCSNRKAVSDYQLLQALFQTSVHPVFVITHIASFYKGLVVIKIAGLKPARLCEARFLQSVLSESMFWIFLGATFYCQSQNCRTTKCRNLSCRKQNVEKQNVEIQVVGIKM